MGLNLKGVIAVALMVVIATAGVIFYQSNNSNMALAKEYVRNAITRLQELPESQKAFLTHSLGNEPEEWLNEAYNASDLELNQSEIKVGSENMELNQITFTNSKGEKVALSFTEDNIITSISIYNPNTTLEEWQKQSEAKYAQDTQAFKYHISDHTKKQMAKIISMGQESSDLTFLGEETINGKNVKKYRFTDKYSRKIAYTVDDESTIQSLIVETTPQGTTRISNGQNNIPTGWKIYNNAFGYEIAYPADWFALDSSTSLPYSLSEYGISVEEPSYTSPGTAVQIIVNESTLQDEMAIMADRPTNEKLNGYDAVTYSAEFYKIYLIESEGKVYRINISRMDDYNNNKNIVDTILSSFKLK